MMSMESLVVLQESLDVESAHAETSTKEGRVCQKWPARRNAFKERIGTHMLGVIRNNKQTSSMHT